MLTLLLTAVLAQVLPPSGMPFSRGVSETWQTSNFLPPNGRGAPQVQNLCDQLTAAEKVGSWWCFNGDGTEAAGSAVTLPAVGVSVQRAVTLCPNGINCAAVTATSLDTTGTYYESAATAVNRGAFTMCVVMAPHALGAFKYMLGAGNAGLTQFSGLDMQTGVFNLAIDGAFNMAIGTPIAGQRNFVCATHDGAGTYTPFMDGVAGAPAAGAVFAAIASAKWGYGVLGNGNGTFSEPGVYFGGFYTNTALTSARITALAHAVLADNLSDAQGHLLTYTRTGAIWCPGPGNTNGSVVPANRPCVTDKGILATAAGTNVVTNWEAFDAAAWVVAQAGAATIASKGTADSAIGPEGTMSADPVTFFATTAAADASYIHQASLTAVAYSCQVAVKGVSGSGTLDIGITTSGGAGMATCAFTNTDWTRCEVDNIISTAGPGDFIIGNITSANGGVARPQQAVYLSQAHCETGATVGPLVPTTSAAAARGNGAGTFTLDAVPSAVGSAAFTLVPFATGNLGGTGIAGVSFGAAARALYSDGTTTIAATDGTNTPATNANFNAGTPRRYWSAWSTTNGWAVNDPVDSSSISGPFTAGTWAPSTTFTLIGGLNANAWLKNICFADGREDACR